MKKRIKNLAFFAIAFPAGLNRLGSRLSKRIKKSMVMVAIAAIIVLAGHTVAAQVSPSEQSQSPASLKSVPIPQPDNLGQFVKDKTAAIALGKTLFWDMQVGSDGLQSCASCHFHAGADNRAKNQLHPGPSTNFTSGTGPNYTLKPENYPFHKLQNPNDRSSTVLADNNDITGSQGVDLTKFNDIIPGSAVDNVTVQPDPVFNVNGINVRQVTGRNTPSTINAVFNFRNFWDGRAQNDFNGVNPFGSRDKNAFLYKVATKQSSLQQVKVSLKNSSLASQAVGPPLSDVEESGTGRVFPDVGQKFNRVKTKKLPRETGKKLKFLPPLAKQLVHPEDSVLGKYSNWPKPGLKQKTYETMVKEAFKPEWWDSQQIIKVGTDGSRIFKQPQGALATDEFTLMDYNFSLFMGLSIQLYESTLVSDNTPFDQYMEGNSNALTSQQKLGKQLFEGKAKCVNCHGGAEFTNASVRNVRNERLERMVMGDNGVAVYDNGFYNIGVRPTQEDLGVGGKDPFGNPLSESRLAQNGKFNDPNLSPPISATERVAVDGAFKTPGLRNVALTAPYLHNGGQLTLRQVVDFYNRGGDFHETNIQNLDPDIENLGLSESEKDALVAFMNGLTDARVRNQSAPFDHPQLFIPNGHPGDQNSVTNEGSGKATTALLELPAVGRNGGSPLASFLENSAPAAAQSPTPVQPTSNPLEGSITQQDCPPGSTLQFVAGGYVCMSN
ncbi:MULTISPECIES: cytochrome-c peroxidase [Cyanophyceae]|uniref:cytochrome-c peroxidase n=1 Tax=Cyanophyceae TaxID=3028117 RepID=UPI00168823FA|nr:cytochrome c peroxidase [Trichocoleus sp. FACHB-69]MBD1932565.1 cytochrome C peroxidase [Trichocoleus sp. FACHB-69]